MGQPGKEEEEKESRGDPDSGRGESTRESWAVWGGEGDRSGNKIKHRGRNPSAGVES